MRTVIIITSVAAVLMSSPAFTQQPSQGTAPIPDFSGIWAYAYWPGFEPPASGPGPVRNKLRQRQNLDPDGRPLPAAARPLVGSARLFVGDYTNPILKPLAAEVVKRHGEVSLAGKGYPTPSNSCWPEPPPYIFRNTGMQMLQQPHQITFLYDEDNEFRQVRLNQRHPAHVTPSWYGDSVGHYEGDTLVIDTVGIKIGPFAMVDMFGTPYSEALHVMERYRLIDYEVGKEAIERDANENFRFPATAVWVHPDPDYRGKVLQLEFRVEDEGVFTMPWSATITYRRASGGWSEVVCAENRHQPGGQDGVVPHADKSDF
jgi:hypothetical protein